MNAITRDTMSRDPRFFIGGGFGVTYAQGVVGSFREWEVDSFMARVDVPWIAICCRGRAALTVYPNGVTPWTFSQGDCNGTFPDFLPGLYRYEVEEDFAELCVTTFDEVSQRYTNEDFSWNILRPTGDTPRILPAGTLAVVGVGTIEVSGLPVTAPAVVPGSAGLNVIYRPGSVVLEVTRL